MDDLGDLAELRLLVVQATFRRDGTGRLSPVWHEWRDGGFHVVTGSRDVKAAQLWRDPRASIVACEHSPPYREVELRVTAGRDRSSGHGRSRREGACCLNCTGSAWPPRSGQAEPACGSRLLTGRSGKVGGDDVGGVPVEAAAGTVVAHRRARVGVRGGFLHVPKRYSGVEHCGDERVQQRMRPDLLGDPGAAGDPADHSRGAVPVQPVAVASKEDRPLAALAYR
jgi:Pyridoxamine 5'-phosphate oxidase